MNEETKRERPWTPGPWLVSAAKGGWNCVKSQSHSGPIICGPAGLSNEANWTLLSAAPELFEALDRLHGAAWNYSTQEELEQAHLQALAALAKALGGQP